LDLCDIAITRGGTTSLAEQELFGIKKIIIPIPRTHDQAKNAEYYKTHHDDIVLDQYANSFIDNLRNAIEHCIGYKK
jgi:UDP-N-acetylglucosamine:LPS N-acetylglucosamine transferase